MGEVPERNLVASPAKPGGMPAWLKVGIAVAIVAIIGTIALVGVLGAFFVRMGKGVPTPTLQRRSHVKSSSSMASCRPGGNTS